MRRTKLIVLSVIFTLPVSIAMPAFAVDAAAAYKANCAACHGPEGQGKVGPAVKGVSLTTAPDHRSAHQGRGHQEGSAQENHLWLVPGGRQGGR